MGYLGIFLVVVLTSAPILHQASTLCRFAPCLDIMSSRAAPPKPSLRGAAQASPQQPFPRPGEGALFRRRRRAGGRRRGRRVRAVREPLSSGHVFVDHQRASLDATVFRRSPGRRGQARAYCACVGLGGARPRARRPTGTIRRLLGDEHEASGREDGPPHKEEDTPQNLSLPLSLSLSLSARRCPRA